MRNTIFRVFISSPFLDLQAERASVKQGIEDTNQVLSTFGIALVPIDLQRGARPRPPIVDCLKEVTSSNIFIGLLGFRYGSLDPETGKSISEFEYEKACELNIPALMYIRDSNSFVTQEYIDTDPKLISKREAFQRKIDKNFKRDTFQISEELSGYVLRDLLHLIISSERFNKIVPTFGATESPVIISEFYTNLKNRNIKNCVSILLDRKVKADFTRMGVSTIRIDMLRQVLGLSSLEKASLVEDPNERGPLLIELADIYEDMAYSCLTEASELAFRVSNFKALTHINTDLSKWSLGCGKVKDAKKYVSKAFKYAKLDSKPHTLATAFIAKGGVHFALKQNRRALKCFWKSIELLCMEGEICFFCLANSFTNAGLAHWALGQCILARDRLGKALYIGKELPSRHIQKEALRNLAMHFETHAKFYQIQEEWKIATAAYVWCAQMTKEVNPEDNEADLNILLQDMINEIGRDRVNALYLSVRNNAKDVVLDALSGFKLGKFISEIGVKSSSHGDHW